jgi:hypothetical protein
MHPGPATAAGQPVVVSLTEFSPKHRRDLLGIAREGISLSRGWWAMPGAVGVSLYLDLASLVGGSISVWTNREDLGRFVSLPRHRQIIRRYRARVSVRSATWTTDEFHAAAVYANRLDLLDGMRMAGAEDLIVRRMDRR